MVPHLSLADNDRLGPQDPKTISSKYVGPRPRSDVFTIARISWQSLPKRSSQQLYCMLTNEGWNRDTRSKYTTAL